MATQHHFTLALQWPGGRNAVGQLDCGALQTPVSIIQDMGGPGVGTNPDDMLLGAAGTCYLMTLAAMIERARLPLASISLRSEAIITVSPQGSYDCSEITHRPSLALQAGTDAAQWERLRGLAFRADDYCMVSKALRGNVTIRIEPELPGAPDQP